VEELQPLLHQLSHTATTGELMLPEIRLGLCTDGGVQTPQPYYCGLLHSALCESTPLPHLLLQGSDVMWWGSDLLTSPWISGS